MFPLMTLIFCLGLGRSVVDTNGSLDVYNIGLATESPPALSGPWACFTIDEAHQGGLDLNADGDADDAVYHVLDTRTGELRNLGVASVSGRDTIPVSKGVFVLFVFEANSGLQDLNGDGDAIDRIAFVYDAKADDLRNLGLALTVNYAADSVIDESYVCLKVGESEQGGVDLNGDGDAQDEIVFWHDVARDLTCSTGLATIRNLVLDSSWAAIQVSEVDQAGTDLNGDGTVDDDVLHVVDLMSGEIVNLGQSSSAFSVWLGPGFLLYFASEFGDNIDYDGDGTIGSGGTAHLFDARRQTLENLGLAGSFLGFSPQIDGLFYFTSGGVIGAVPVSAYDVRTGTLTSLGVDTRAGTLGWQRFAAIPSLNTQEPIEVIDTRTGSIRNPGGGPGFFAAFEEGLLTYYDDAVLGAMHVYDPLLDLDLTVGETTLAGDQAFDRDGHRVSWNGNEFFAGIDWNGDGDMSDGAIRIFDGCTDEILTIPLATSGLNPLDHRLEGDRLLFKVDEFGQAGKDLNGDGDADDRVLHLAILDTAQTFEAPYGEGLTGAGHRTPQLDLLGCAAPGRAFTVLVRNGRGGAIGVLLVGTAPALEPLFGGTLLVQAPFALVLPHTLEGPIDASGLGEVRLPLGTIDVSLAGVSLYLQVGYLDNAAPQGVSLSPGRILIPAATR